MKIIWRRQARDDAREAYAYLLDKDPYAALRIFEAIEKSVEMLADFPAIGRAGRVENTRELVITGTPYIAAYRVDSRIDAVIILAVIHAARAWSDTLES